MGGENRFQGGSYQLRVSLRSRAIQRHPPTGIFHASFKTSPVVKNKKCGNSNAETFVFSVFAMSSSSTHSSLRTVDRDLLVVLRGVDWMGIGDLTAALGVTATAVRQRIDRLLEARLIEREKEVSGRGRPTFRYRLTVLGHQTAGANPAELADAMWREILAIQHADLRDQVVAGVATRLGRQFAAKVASSLGSHGSEAAEPSVEQRIRHLAGVLSDQEIDSDVRVPDGAQLPVLDIASCPYPSLTDISDDRAMCRLEEQMLSEALGTPVELSSCRLDGDSCCQFSVSEKTTPDS